jgi:hypothetical protein
MGDEETDVTTDKTLRYLGILTALKGFPGQFAVAVLSIALVEAVYLSLSIPAGLIPGSNQQVIVVVIGAVVGDIAYTAGNFWDRVVFNRLYGLEGTRLDKPASTFFPSGKDLKRTRNRAIETVQSADSDGVGIYRDSKDIVTEDEAKWKTVEEPVVLSKIARAFIWPCVLVAFACGLAYLVGPALGWHVNAASLLFIGMGSACFAILLFIPYFEYRVEHMIRLYRAATRMRS